SVGSGPAGPPGESRTTLGVDGGEDQSAHEARATGLVGEVVATGSCAAPRHEGGDQGGAQHGGGEAGSLSEREGTRGAELHSGTDPGQDRRVLGEWDAGALGG